MIVLKYTVRNQRLSRYNSAAIAETSDVVLEFDFQTSDWNGVGKKANFSYGDNNYIVDLDDDNRCQVPQSVLKIPFFKVAVYGGNIVTNTIKVFVNRIYIDNDEDEVSGKYYIPIVDSNGNLSWSASHDKMPELPSVNIKGEAGVGIVKIEKGVSTEVGDTYKIVLTNGETSEFNVNHGVGIKAISNISTHDLVDTYEILLTNNKTYQFDVINGRDGAEILGTEYVETVEKDGVKYDIYKISYSNGRSDLLEFPCGGIGDSAYQIWLKNGNTGSEVDFLASLVGEQGSNGESAYEIWLRNGNEGDEEDFLLSLVGQQGETGVSIAGIEQTYKSEDNSGNNLITVTLSDGKIFPFEIKNGKGINSIEKMSIDSDGSVTHNNYVIHYSDGTQDELTLDAMTGEKGDPGKDGSDGFSPIIDVEETEGGNKITIITDILGNEYIVEVKDGADGINGVDGVGIVSVEQIGYSNVDGGTNSLVVTLSDGTTSTFNVKNGSKGETGLRGESGVYIGEGDMPDDCNVQINPSGDIIKIPTKLSELENDMGFITSDNDFIEDGGGEEMLPSELSVSVETDEDGNNILVIGGADT